MLLKHIKMSTYSGSRFAAKSAVAICSAWLLYGCTSPAIQEISPSERTTVDRLVSQFQEVAQQSSADRDRRLLTIAADLVAMHEYQWAQEALQSIDRQLLRDDDYMDYSLLASEVFMQQQQLAKAQTLLTEQRLQQLWERQTIGNRQKLRLRRAKLFSQLGDLVASINERVILSTILPPGREEIDNQEILWQSLMLMPREQLQLLAASTTSIVQGWYQLASISKQHQHDLDAQHSAINQWIAANPYHPASYQLPNDLQLLQQMISARPGKIALLLPLQGKLAKAGRAIRDGFFAAYYHGFNSDQDMPSVSVVDTDSSDDINLLYNRAVAGGAELIIGPLSKDKVTALQLRPDLPAVTLALNYIDQSVPTKSDNLFQFGLSLDREAVQAADRAWLEGHRTALVIAADANWSARTARAFAKKWQALGGKVVHRSEFSQRDNYSNVVKSALHIDNSQQRAKALKRLLARSFEFEPRRRGDIDMIFLVARTQQARQIKPALAFYYAEDIPVYSTGKILVQARNQRNSGDLDGIRFTTLPWLIDDTIPTKQSIRANLATNSAYAHLYAMGVDTFLLYPRLQQLRQIANSSLSGVTGQLVLARNNRILRKHQWAEIHRGQVRVLPTIVGDRITDEEEIPLDDAVNQ